MLNFNCTQAACNFFSRVHKGKKITPVQTEIVPARDAATANSLQAESSQWLVHAATVQRKHVLLAIHVQTRYCMLFFDMKKADADGFVCAFKQRWLDGVVDYALHSGVLELIEPSVMHANFDALTHDYCFLQRSHRSAQGHLNEILRGFRWDAEDHDLVAQDWSPLRFDSHTNSTPRGGKGKTGYDFPGKEMLIYWLQDLCELHDSQFAGVREALRQNHALTRAFLSDIY